MEIVYTPPPRKPQPKPPSWWRTFFKPTGTVVKHNDAYWKIVEDWSWGEYDGRRWLRLTEEAVDEYRFIA